jgi:hypothetical protein
MSDMRSATRWPSCLKGKVLAEDGRMIDCLVRDFSESGAKIELPRSTKLPDTVDLFFPLRQETFRAHIRWRGDKEIGLTFEAPQAEAPTDPVQAKLLARLLELEAENAALREQMALMRFDAERTA